MKLQEKNLKDLIENRGVGSEAAAFRAAMTLRLYQQRFEGITYDEAIALANENDLTIQHMSVDDPAFLHLIEMRNAFLKYATALNDIENMGRHDHELPVHALVSVAGVAIECNFHIPRLYYRKHEREKIITSTLRGKINQSNDWVGTYRHPSKIDFVEL